MTRLASLVAASTRIGRSFPGPDGTHQGRVLLRQVPQDDVQAPCSTGPSSTKASCSPGKTISS
ncbi:MAG TPA: hypothetical protein VN379_18540 [Sporomusa sp.]|nr:hypothetical protein [Sporomusa sp.]